MRFDFPGFVPAYIRPLFCKGIGPFRWAALSGDPEDIYKTDEKVKELIPDDPHLHNWLNMRAKRFNSRDCLQGFVGLDWATGIDWAWRLTKWFTKVNCLRPL